MKRIKIFLLLFICISLNFFNACGLDTYYVLEAPVSIGQEPSVTSSTYTSSTAYDSAYFEFKTADGINSSSGDFKYQGTAVYYKIYNNYSTMNSHISTISSLSSSTNASAAATKVIDTYGYRPLGVADGRGGGAGDQTVTGSLNPLVDADTSTQRVYIRLTNYNADISYGTPQWQNSSTRAKIIFGRLTSVNGGGEVTDEALSSGSYKEYYPIRDVEKKNFDFGVKNSEGQYDYPAEGDVDVNYSSSASQENIWYVNLYAVSVGRDNSFTTYYSDVLHLGAVAIDASEEDN